MKQSEHHSCLSELDKEKVGLPFTWIVAYVLLIWTVFVVDWLNSPAQKLKAVQPLTFWEAIARRWGDDRTDIQIRLDSSLVYAVYSKDIARVKQLLNFGADPNGFLLDPCGLHDNALFAASQEGDEVLVTILLNAGADPNVLCAGDSPLSAAKRYGYTRIAHQLIAAGAK
ncbi:MAG: ankyrin repeat domain-containing protein [Zavarzinella sp.]